MGYYCTVPQCTSLAGKTKNVKFHRFPRDNNMAVKWNTILKRGKPITKYSKVCSLHFTPTDYNITTMGRQRADGPPDGQWKTLSKDAIPTQNLPKLNPDGTVMVIRKSRTVKYKECKKEEISVKEEKFTSVAPTHNVIVDGVKQEQPEATLPYRLIDNLQELPKPRKQDATMQTDPILSEDEQTEFEQFEIEYDMPKDFSKQNDDYIPQTNEEYDKEADKYALQRKMHTQYDKNYQKVENYVKLPEYNFREKDYTDFVYQNSYTDSVEILRNQQHNLQMLQEQHRVNENQNFFNENHIKQEIDFQNEDKFLYEGNKEQIDHPTLYEHREQRIMDHGATVKQEPEVTGACESVMQPQTSPYYPTEGATNVTGSYYPSLSRPGPELLIAKQNALAAHTQLWQNQKRPFMYSDSTHYNTNPMLHRCEDFSRIIQ